MKGAEALRAAVVICILLPGLRAAGVGRIVYVDDDGPADFGTIQAAIDDANDGDMVVIQPGLYTGDGNRDIHIIGKVVTVTGTDPNDWNVVGGTIIDCENVGGGFHIRDDRLGEARLEGLTIRRAAHGAIRCYGRILMRAARGARVATSNAALGSGFGSGPVLIRRCLIVDNPGGGILLDCHPNVTVANCHIAHNGSAGAWTFMSWPAFRHCTVVENAGHGIRANGGEIVNCTIAGNDGIGLWVYDVAIANCIVWGNAQAQLYDPREQATATFSAVQDGFPGAGNIAADPLFSSAGHWDPNGTPEDPNDDFRVQGDYRLKSQAGRWEPSSQEWVIDDVTSPCIDAGDPNSPVGDEPEPNGSWINMGAYGGTREASRSYLVDQDNEPTPSRS